MPAGRQAGRHRDPSSLTFTRQQEGQQDRHPTNGKREATAPCRLRNTSKHTHEHPTKTKTTTDIPERDKDEIQRNGSSQNSKGYNLKEEAPEVRATVLSAFSLGATANSRAGSPDQQKAVTWVCGVGGAHAAVRGAKRTAC